MPSSPCDLVEPGRAGGSPGRHRGDRSPAPGRRVDSARPRGDMARTVRRAIGIREEPPRIANDPDDAYLPPTAWRGGCTATCPPCSSAESARSCCSRSTRSPWRAWRSTRAISEDPLGRLRRTAAFVGTTTFGTVAEAEDAIAQVQRVHRRVKGIAPDGRPYSADDPELVTFIHVAEVSSFLASSQRYGPRPLTPEECDRYFEEVAPVALALGANWAPRSSDEVRSYLLRIRPELYAGPQAKAARDWLVRGVARRPSERAVYALGAGGRRQRATRLGSPRARTVARRPPRPARRYRCRGPAHARADRRPALDGERHRPEVLRSRGRSRRRRPRPGRSHSRRGPAPGSPPPRRTGCPERLSGATSLTPSRTVSQSAVQGVSTSPGATALTRTSGPTTLARRAVM